MSTSYFWRNPLQQQVVLGVFRSLYDPEHDKRILDVGCCTGEMVLTYAMLLRDEYGKDWHERFPITAMDVDPQWIETCRRGLYPPTRLYQIPRTYRSRYVNEYEMQLVQHNEVRQDIKPRRMAIFKNTAIQDCITWLAQDFNDFVDNGHFSLVFCQNVLLHLSAEQSDQFLRKIHALLHDGSFLVCAGRNASDWRTLYELGFEPVPHDVRAVYDGWLQRKSAKNPTIQLKKYDPEDPFLQFKIGSVFSKGAGREPLEDKEANEDDGAPDDLAP